MKAVYLKFILVSGLFLILRTVNAQQYQSIFGTNQTSWKYSYAGCLGCSEIDSANVDYGSDTIIQNRTFKKVIPTNKNSFLTDFYLSEDSSNSQVYYYNPDYIPNQIFKISDLSLTVGDTLKALGAIVDSVYYVNSLKYVRTNYHTMIEGVGTDIGVNYQTMGLADGLLCQIKDNVTNYTGNHPTLNCNSPLVSINEVELSNQISILPNPASCQVNVQIEAGFITQLELLDVKGRSIRIIDNPENEINTSDLSSGIYFIRITTDKGVGTKKLIISK